MKAAAGPGQLIRLARLYGVQTAYQDVWGRQRQAAAEALLAVLAALGAPVGSAADVPAALRQRRLALWQRCCEPVTVAWAGAPGHAVLWLPVADATGWVHCHLALEGGEVTRWSVAVTALPVLHADTVEGADHVALGLPLPGGLPPGYHQLSVSLRGRQAETLVLAAPRTAYGGDAGGVRGVGAAARGAAAAGLPRTWGVFLPLYALHSRHSWGAGDLDDLGRLLAWAEELGAGLVGTLPLLAAFLAGEPFDASPYAPASRLFWNEFYLDLAAIPELAHCPPAQALLAARPLRQTVAELRAAPLVDYRRQMACKRQVLDLLATCCFEALPGRRAELERYLAAHPNLADYARFRAAGERQQAPWTRWPQPQRDGALDESDYDPAAYRYHLYVQWLADTQLQAVADRARRQGPGLYLDLPLGVHAAGYDVWRERGSFATGVSGGAPPDRFFPLGQDWAVPVLHPEGVRQTGYRYVIAALRHQLRKAGVLRIDHVMGLHRLFWIPRGFDARHGVYVRYRAEEFYAILALESRRHRTLVVGEDLGTVPRQVRAAMARHGIHRLYVLPFEEVATSTVAPAAGSGSGGVNGAREGGGDHAAGTAGSVGKPARRPRRPLRPVPGAALATLNTHDMPPFAAWWQERTAAAAAGDTPDPASDPLVAYLRRGGWLTAGTGGAAGAAAGVPAGVAASVAAGAARAANGAPGGAAVLQALLRYLSASPAALVLVSLEDLWLETAPQNVPGSGAERSNWRRKARYSLEHFSALPAVRAALTELDQLRKRGQER